MDLKLHYKVQMPFGLFVVKWGKTCIAKVTTSNHRLHFWSNPTHNLNLYTRSRQFQDNYNQTNLEIFILTSTTFSPLFRPIHQINSKVGMQGNNTSTS